MISVAALALDADGRVEHSVVSLLNPGVDPGPTHVHGLTAEMLEDQPTFAEIAGDLAELLRAAHSSRTTWDSTMRSWPPRPSWPRSCCRSTPRCAPSNSADGSNSGWTTCRLETLAQHWGVTQTRPHDAFDDALVLSRVLAPALDRARQREVWLPVRPVTRRRWPNGRITHEELKPLKALAARMPCPYLNPGRYIGGRPMVQGMRVALSSEVVRTHEELVERILHAGLAYSESVDPETSMVICNEASPTQGKGYAAREIGVPVVSDGEFMDNVSHVIGGTGVEEFTDATADGEQFALF